MKLLHMKDMALVVDSGVSHQKIMSVMKGFSLVTRTEVFDVYVQPGCLMLEKTACAGGAHRIHAEIDHDIVANQYDLAILTPDFDNRLHSRDVMHGGNSMAGDFILYEVSAKDNTGKVASAPSGGDSADLGPGRHLVSYILQAPLNYADWLALSPQISGRNQLILLVHQGQFGSNRSNINTEISPHFLLRLLLNFSKSTKASSLVIMPGLAICSS